MSRPADTVRPLLRARQTREFADTPLDPEAVDAIADAARWSGSGQNKQPWRFIVIQSRETLDAIAQAGAPSTRALATAQAAIAVAMPAGEGKGISLAYDEGRAAERMLVAASMLGLGAAITWIGSDARERVAELLGLPEERFVRTVLAIGHPTPGARRPKSPPGGARLERAETVFEERWPG